MGRDVAENVVEDEVEIAVVGIDLVVVQGGVDFDEVSATEHFYRLDAGERRVHLCACCGVAAYYRGGEVAGGGSGHRGDGTNEVGLFHALWHLLVQHAVVVHLKEHAIFAAVDEGVDVVAQGAKRQEENGEDAKELGVDEESVPKIVGTEQFDDVHEHPDAHAYPEKDFEHDK